MKLERVLTITMSSIFFQVAGQVDDGDGFKWAFLSEKKVPKINKKPPN